MQCLESEEQSVLTLLFYGCVDFVCLKKKNITYLIIIPGYIGENCHFATFRKTCEELALLGYTRNDVYLIDIDGNGKFPPAHVKCEFQIEADSSTTVVEHNLPSQVVSLLYIVIV